MNKDLHQVGVTGGIGAGKSVICRIFSVLGIPVYDADKKARSLMQEDPGIKQQIISAFGTESYIGERLNREYLAKEVFAEDEKTSHLNAIVHPKVGEDYYEWKMMHKEVPYVIKEAALLFEAGSFMHLDKIIVITAPVELRIERVLQRDPHRSRQDVTNIINKQWTEAEKVKSADFVINNDGTSMVIPQVLKIHQQLVNWKT